LAMDFSAKFLASVYFCPSSGVNSSLTGYPTFR